MCNKCRPGGHYDATLEQLNHDPDLLRMQNLGFVFLKLWYGCICVCFALIKHIWGRRAG